MIDKFTNIQKEFCKQLQNNFNFTIDLKIIQLDMQKACLLAKNVNLHQLYDTLLHHNLLYKNLHRNENIYFAPSHNIAKLDMAFIDDPSFNEQNKIIFQKLSFAIIQTSENKYQVIFKLDKQYDIKDVFKIQQYLTKRFNADKAATSVYQFRRVPGFLNTKYKPHFLVTAKYYNNTLKVHAILDEIHKNYKHYTQKIQTTQHKNKNCNWQFFYNFKSINYDESRADFLYTLYLLKRNFTDEEIKHILINESLCINTRKKNLEDYLQRTLSKAKAYLESHPPIKTNA